MTIRRRRWPYLFNQGGFNPLLIPNLALWLDAADASTITLDGSSNVEEWRDKSGNARHSTQASTLLRPAYTTAAVNGLNALTFDASDDLLSCYNAAANPCTWFAVHKWSGANRDTRIGGNSPLSGVSIGISAASSWNMSFVRDGIAWVPSGFAQGTVTRLYRMAYDLSSSSFWTYGGGVETLRQTTALTGTLGVAANLGMPGQLCEVVMYERALTAPEIAAVEAYLATKWSVNVAGVANPSLWLDASDVSTITLDGSNNVSGWADKSGYGRHAVMATVNKRPAYTVGAINSLNVVTFDGVDDVMSGATLLAADTDFTMFAVVKKLGASSVSGTSYFHLGTDKSFGLSLGSTGANNNKGAYLNGGVAWRVEGGADIANGTVVRQQLSKVAGAGGTASYVRKGGFTLTNAETPGATPYGVYNIGSQTTGGTSYQNLQLCEAIFFERLLSAGEITLIQNYLDTKWGVP